MSKTTRDARAVRFGRQVFGWRSAAAALSLAAFWGWAGGPARAQTAKFDPVRDVGIEQKLDAQVPLDIPFRDDRGREVRLGEYFGQKPVILNLIFYKCAGSCVLESDGMVNAFKFVKFRLGKDFNVVTVSINPRETPELAAAKKKQYVDFYGRPGAAEGWHFLTGESEAIERLAKAVGFKYYYNAQKDEFAHPAGIMILTPQGRISRYFNGVEYIPKDLRLALVEAGENKIGSPVDKVLGYCYQYDPLTGRYGLVIKRVLQVSGISTFLLLGGFMLVMFRRERRQAAKGGG